MNHNLQVLFIALGIIPCAVGANCAQGQESATSDRLIDAVLAQYARLNALRSLHVRYRIDTVNSPDTHVQFAWPWVEMENAIKRPQLFVHETTPEPYPTSANPATGSEELKEIYATWNGVTGIKLTLKKASNKLSPDFDPKAEITADANEFILRRLYYTNALYWELGRRPDELLIRREKFPAKDYWFPQALTDNRHAYHLLKGRKEINGDPCYVIERTGLDKIWLNPEYGDAITRREFRWSIGGAIRQSIEATQFEQVDEGLWLPRRIVIRDYCDPWTDPKKLGSLAYSLTLNVTAIAVNDLPDTLFNELPIPDFTNCYDWRTKSRFIFYPRTHEQLQHTVEELLSGQPELQSGRWSWWRIAGIVVPTMIFGVYIMYTTVARRARRSR